MFSNSHSPDEPGKFSTANFSLPSGNVYRQTLPFTFSQLHSRRSPRDCLVDCCGKEGQINYKITKRISL